MPFYQLLVGLWAAHLTLDHCSSQFCKNRGDWKLKNSNIKKYFYDYKISFCQNKDILQKEFQTDILLVIPRTCSGKIHCRCSCWTEGNCRAFWVPTRGTVRTQGSSVSHLQGILTTHTYCPGGSQPYQPPCCKAGRDPRKT